jgi:hypothetical protein
VVGTDLQNEDVNTGKAGVELLAEELQVDDVLDELQEAWKWLGAHGGKSLRILFISAHSSWMSASTEPDETWRQPLLDRLKLRMVRRILSRKLYSCLYMLSSRKCCIP